MHEYWIEFGKVAVAHLLAVASPGPDFAIVVKQSLTHGRRTALWTTFGIAMANLLQVSYSLLGLGLLIRGSELWFNIVKYAGAAYLGWIGIQALRARPAAAGGGLQPSTTRVPDERGAFATGFLTNVLNPKATLFFISLFALVVSAHTPRPIQAAYGLWMAFVTAAWFAFVSVVFTRAEVRGRFLRHGHWIDRALGVVFIAFAASLAVATLR